MPHSDTRSLVVNATGATAKALKTDPLFERLNETSFLTFPHDVFNTSELIRLKEDWFGEYEIDGPYLINAITGCEIQPTRGFGDFDMFGTGYISVPDISRPFPLEPGERVSMLLIASVLILFL